MDMPALNDRCRVLRCAMVIDEIRRTAMLYRCNQFSKVRNRISSDEFFLIGGRKFDTLGCRWKLIPKPTDGLFTINDPELLSKTGIRVANASCDPKDRVFTLKFVYKPGAWAYDDVVKCQDHYFQPLDQEFDLYRQVVYNKRDFNAYNQRGCFPTSGVVTAAAKQYEFYPSDDEDITKHSERISIKDKYRTMRLVIVLKKFRRFMQRHENALDTPLAQDDFNSIRLTFDEFVACGGHRGEKAASFCYYRMVVLSKRDVQKIMQVGRFKNYRLSCLPFEISSEEEEEDEKLDRLDYVKGAGVGTCEDVDNHSDENGGPESDVDE